MASIAFRSTILAQASGTAALTNGHVHFSALAVARATGECTLEYATIAFSGSATGTATGSITGTLGHTIAFGSTITIAATGTAAGSITKNLSGKATAQATGRCALTRDIALRSTVSAIASGFIRGDVDTQGLTLADAAKAVLVVLHGCACRLEDVDGCLQDEILGAINAAHQQIYSRAQQLDYFNLATLTLTVLGGEESVDLPQNVQNMRGPVRLADTKQKLAPIMTRHAFENFCSLYGVSTELGTPIAYHLDPNGQQASDSVLMTLYVAPIPTDDTDLLVDVSLEPTRYRWSDITRGTPLSLPNKYGELLLLPIVRKWATGHPHFTRREMQPQIDEQYAAAMTSLGLLEPQSAEAKPKAATAEAPRK